MILLLTLLGCPAPGDDSNTAEACPDGLLEEADVGCACGDETFDTYDGCAVSTCTDDVLEIDESNCCKATGGC